MECKWSSLIRNDVKHILELLKEKSGHLKWNNDNRIEHFGIIAKKIQDKETFGAQGLWRSIYFRIHWRMIDNYNSWYTHP